MKKNILEEAFPETLKILSDLIKFQTVSGTSNIKLIDYCEKKLGTLGANSFRTFDDKKLRANFAVRFEHLEKDFCTLKALLHLPKTKIPQNLTTKSTFRPIASRNWQNFYDEDTIELVRKCCAEEIKSFNYSFEGDTHLLGPHLKL